MLVIIQSVRILLLKRIFWENFCSHSTRPSFIIINILSDYCLVFLFAYYLSIINNNKGIRKEKISLMHRFIIIFQHNHLINRRFHLSFHAIQNESEEEEIICIKVINLIPFITFYFRNKLCRNFKFSLFFLSVDFLWIGK